MLYIDVSNNLFKAFKDDVNFLSIKRNHSNVFLFKQQIAMLNLTKNVLDFLCYYFFFKIFYEKNSFMSKLSFLLVNSSWAILFGHNNSENVKNSMIKSTFYHKKKDEYGNSTYFFSESDLWDKEESEYNYNNIISKKSDIFKKNNINKFYNETVDNSYNEFLESTTTKLKEFDYYIKFMVDYNNDFYSLFGIMDTRFKGLYYSNYPYNTDYVDIYKKICNKNNCYPGENNVIENYFYLDFPHLNIPKNLNTIVNDFNYDILQYNNNNIFFFFIFVIFFLYNFIIFFLNIFIFFFYPIFYIFYICFNDNINNYFYCNNCINNYVFKNNFIHIDEMYNIVDFIGLSKYKKQTLLSNSNNICYNNKYCFYCNDFNFFKQEKNQNINSYVYGYPILDYFIDTFLFKKLNYKDYFNTCILNINNLDNIYINDNLTVRDYFDNNNDFFINFGLMH